jgi:chaperone modulatory protein CbpM
MTGHMIAEKELIQAVGNLEADALRRWIDLGWVLPQADGDQARFDASDVARVRLICELHYELHIEEDSLSVVLSLLDQLYTARYRLRALLSAVEAQPEDVRASIAARVKAQG